MGPPLRPTPQPCAVARHDRFPSCPARPDGRGRSAPALMEGIAPQHLRALQPAAWQWFLSPENGHFALALACAFACAQCLLPALGARLREPRLARLGGGLAWSQALCLVMAFLCLGTAAVQDDFSVRSVAENSARAKPLLYKVAGLWGNHEGSLLLWLLVLALCAALLATTARRAQLPLFLQARVLAILGGISAAFGLFCLLTSSPFGRLLPPPADGAGMNPMLQDPGLAFHPPLLYLGYVGLAVPFAFAVAGLMDKRVTPRWGGWMKPWVLASWGFLTCGITLGSWWSYYVLGWGGYWFWDPVENASLIPWLSSTALVHSTIAVEKRDVLKSWSLLLAIASFSFSLAGTFLVRSGILNSVHAFASDPARGVFLLLILGVISGGALALFAWRAPQFPAEPGFPLLTREGALVLNNILLCTLCAIVLVGTLYPPFVQLLFSRTLSVGKPFFDSTTIPVFLLLLLLLGIVCALGWRYTKPAAVLRALRLPALLGCLAFPLALIWLAAFPPALCAALAVWVLAATALELQRRWQVNHRAGRARKPLPASQWAMALAHMGVAVSVLGMCGMSAARHDIVELPVGGSVSFAGRCWKLAAVSPVQGPNYRAERAMLQVSRPTCPTNAGKPFLRLTPERRFFPLQDQTLAQVALHITPLGDLYAVLGPSRLQATPHGRQLVWVLRLHDNPLAVWIWAGGLFMALGAVIALLGRSRRPAVAARGEG
nr:heme lyase CcmF/NrfE family subunit [Oecophyllibacter saccharovorans]